jgi:hypothetical protein
VDLATAFDDVDNKRSPRSIRREIAAHRLDQCEDNMRSLREDIRKADKAIQEMDDGLQLLQSLVQQVPAATTPPNALTTFYDSGPSSECASSISEADSMV